MYLVLSSLDRWFLGAMASASEAGIYSVGYNVAIIGTMVNTAIAAVWLPEAAKQFETDKASAHKRLGVMVERLIVLLAVVWLAVVAAGGDILRLLAAEKFHAAASVIPFIATAVFFNGVLQIATAGNLLAGKLHRTVPWWLLGALVCIGLNLVLIPAFGSTGAAVTQACAFGVVAAGVWLSAQRELPLEVRSMQLIAFLAVMVVAAIFMEKAWSPNPLDSLAGKLPVGVVLACTAAFWIARKDFLLVLRRAVIRFGVKK
jgi:O-antigen/teichoic acid export membrane protein